MKELKVSSSFDITFEKRFVKIFFFLQIILINYHHMTYDFSDFNKRKENIIEWLKKEFSSLRTGRANTALLDAVKVNSYGAKVPLNQTANISVEDARTILISPWDKSLIQQIERGIIDADLGLSTSVGGDSVRIIFPELTTENREKLVKVAKSKVEEAKISLRGERADVIKEIEKEQKAGNISEDDAKRDKEELQKIIEGTQKTFDELAKKKEEEIMN
jgi:ribosome recycling factor